MTQVRDEQHLAEPVIGSGDPRLQHAERIGCESCGDLSSEAYGVRLQGSQELIGTPLGDREGGNQGGQI